MEGEGDITLPEGGGGGSMTKIIAAIVVIIIVVAAIAGAVLLMGGETENKAPTATATASKSVVTVGEVVTFNGSQSTDPDGEELTYSWNFGDGTTDNESGAIVSHYFDYPGKYLVFLTVMDEKGASDTNWESPIQVEVLHPEVGEEEIGNETLPYAIAAAKHQVIESGTVIDFDAASSAAYSVDPTYASPIMDGQGNYIGWTPITNESGYIIDWQNISGVDSVIVGWINTTDEAGWIVSWEPIIEPEAIEWTVNFDSKYITSIIWYFGDGSEPIFGTFDECATVNHTYSGDGDIYPAFVEVLSVHDVTQRYYITIVVSPAEQPGSIGVKNPDTFVMATIGEPETLDPALCYDSASGEILQNVYETLIWYDRGSASEFVPMLATEVPTVENGGISPGGLNYTFHIREDVNFHVKDPQGNYYTVDGYDVEYSIERVLLINDPEGPVWMLAQVLYPDWPGPGELLDESLVDAAVTVNPDDPMEVTFHLVSPYPAFISVLAYTIGSVVCKEFVEAHGGVVPLEKNEYMERHEAGTGPYKLVSWKANEHILMERFDDYWREPAQLKYVIIKKVQDTGTRLMMLLSGDADCAYVPRQQRESVIGNPDLRIVEGLPTFDMGFYGFNQNISEGLDVGDIPADFFADINIRNAFIHAFNYDTFLNDILAGTGIQPNGPIPLGMFGYTPEVPNYTYDLALAAEYLNKTDYAETGFHIILYYNAGNDEREAACMLFETGLEALSSYIEGTIEVDHQQLDWPTYLNALYGKQLPIFFLGWAPDYADPDDYVNPFLHSSGVFPYFLSISNSTLDELIEEAAMELNLTRRAELYAEISWDCYYNAYYLWTSQTKNFHVERAWVTGYYFNPMYSGLYYYALGKAT